MSTEKLSELSKPVAYGYQIASACIADGDDKKWVDWSNKLTHECPPDWMVEDGKVTGLKPLYSQEYVSALTQLIAELEEEFAFIMGQNDGMEKELRDKDARIEHLEAKLATPVRLQSPWVDKVGNRWLLEGTTADVIRTAGFAVTVEGDE